MSDLTDNSKLQTAWINFKNKIEDFISLDVTTLTGDVKLVFKDGKVDLEGAFKNMATTPDSKIRMVAHTWIAADKDALFFVASDLTAEEQKLLDAHQAAVKNSLEARHAFVKFVGESLLGLIKV